MATLPNNLYEFEDFFNMIDFIKPLIVEGYPVIIQKIYGERPLLPGMERETLGFQVEIGPKGENVKVYLPDEKAEFKKE